MVAIFTGSGLGLERGSGMVLGGRGLLGQAAMGRAGDNVFVNAATGNLLISRTDEMLLGVGPDAVLTRTYNSQGAFNDENDDNWRFGASRRVHGLTGTLGASGSTVTRTDWDGSETVYAWVSGNTYRTTDGAGAHDTLVFTGSAIDAVGSYWTWTDGDTRTVEIYNTPATGTYRLASQADLDGKTVTFGYNASGFVEKITTASTGTGLTAPGTEYILLTYTGDNVTEVTTYHQADGDNVYETIKRVRYGYDGSDRLTSVTVDLSPGDGVIADGKIYTITYGYDGSDRINSITQTDGSSLAITYNGAGKVETLTQTASSGVTRVTSFTYNTNSTVITDPFSQTTTLNYDAKGNLTSMVAPPAVSGGTAQTYSYTYDSSTGDLLTVVDPSGKTVEYTYDASGNRLTERDHAGNTVIRTFGSNNQVLTESRYLTPDASGGGLSPADPLTTRYAYDSENHLRYVITAEGRVTEYRYDASGQQTSAIEYAGNAYDVSALAANVGIAEGTLDSWVTGISDKSTTKRTDIAYTFRGAIDHVTSFGVVLSSGAGDTIATTEITKTVYIYDQAGNLLSRKIDGANTAETYLYDGLNRITSTTDYSGLTTTMAYGDAASTTTVTVGGAITKLSTYNLAGELISSAESATGLSAVTTVYRYDALGRLRGVTDPTGVKTYILYDRVGRKVGEVDGAGALTEFRYNADNLLVSTTRYKTLLASSKLDDLNNNTANMTYELAHYRPSSDAADIWEWRVYDAAHRLIETINGAGAAVVYEYDGASQLVKTTAYANLIAAGTVTGYKTTGPTSLVTPTADASNDRVARTFYDKDGRLLGTLDAEGYLTKVVYDAAGQRIETIAYSGATSTTYRASGTFAQLLGSITLDTAKDIHIWSVYDQRGLLRATIDGEGGVVRYHYTAQGFLDQEIRGQKLSSTDLATYIGGTKPTLANLPAAAGGTILETTVWARDRYGRVLSEVRTLASGSETDVYVYDSAGRLLTVTTATTTAAARTTSYFYDARGRLVAEIGGEGAAVLAAHANRRYDQTLVGTASAETINGGAGNDLIQGLAGNDTLNGLGGDDRLEGGAGADVLNGNEGNDVIVAGINNDVNLYGGTGRDVFVFMSGDGADTIRDFEVGVDLIDLSAMGGYVSMAASGADTIITLSNAGTVTVKNVAPSLLTASSFIFGGYDQVQVGTSGINTINGGAGRDLIQGLAGNDTLNGLGGDDRLEGGDGVDVMTGGDGNDILVSGLGNDVSLTGGAGRDIFVFIAGDGTDTIQDFTVGLDLIDLSALGGYTSITASGSDSVIAVAGGGTITVKNVTPSQLTTDHILLSPQDIAKTFGTTYAYDDGDRLIAKTTSNGAGSTVQKTLYYYDTDGRLAFEINPLGEVVEHRYDAFGRQTDVIAYGTRLSGGTLAILTGGLVNSTVTSAVSGIANSSVDSRVQSTFNVTSTLASTIDAEGATTTFSYNAFDQLAGKVDPLSSGVTRTSTLAYNKRGLLTSTVLDSPGGGLQLQTTTTYDAFGRALTTTDPDGKVRSTTYDRSGRTLTTTDPLSGVTTYTYDGRGAVLTATDRLSNVTTFAYTAFNRSVTMTTQEGIVTTTTTNAHGETISVTDGASRTTTFTYDRDGRLLKASDPLGNGVQNSFDTTGRLSFSVDARGIKTSYSYDATGRVLTAKVDDGGLNLVTTYEYDAKGQQTKVTDAAGRVVAYAFDRNGRTTTVTADPTGLALVTKYEHDLAGRTTKVIEGFGTSAAKVTQHTYDKADRLIQTAVDPAGLNLVTSFAYDKRGNVIARTDAAGKITRFVYDADNRLVWSVDAAGGVIRTTYDAEGRVTATLGYANMVSTGTLTSWGSTPLTETMITSAVSTSASDHAANFVYDRDGRLKYAVNSLGRPVEYIYDGSGNVLRTVQYDGEIAPGSWTVAGVVAAIASGTSHGASGVNLATAAGTRTSRAVYDAAGRQAYSISAMGAVTAFSYDAAGNVVKSIQYAATYATSGDPSAATMASWETSNASAANDRVTRTLYDGAGRATFVADLVDSTVSYVSKVEYDAAGNVLKQIRYAGTYTVSDASTVATVTSAIGTLPGTAAVTTYAYDNAGRVTDVTDAVGSVTRMTYDAAGRVIDTTAAYGTGDAATVRRGYDAAGRMTSEIRGYGATEASTTGYAYDGVGRVLVVTNPRGFTTTRTYDGEGRVLTETVQLASGADAVTTNVYDAFGNLAKVTDARGNAGYFYYDKAGQLTRQVDPENYITDTTYSLGGEVLTVKRFYNKATTGLGSVTTPPSDPTSHAKDATTTIERDKLERVTKVTDAEGFYEQYTLNAFGDRTTVRNKLGADTSNVFDKRGLLTQETLPISAVKFDGTVLQTSVINKYEYDARGNRTKAVEADNVSLDKRTTTFVYDKLDRLVQEIGDQVSVTATDLATTSNVTPTQTITYNLRGNIIQSEDAGGAKTFYFYDDLGRKVAEINALGTFSVWAYDAASNVTSSKIYGDAVSLPSSPGGTPPSPVNGSNYRETTYSYDRNNRLIGTSISGLTTGYFNGTNYVTSTSAITTALEYDAMGNVVVETDALGASVIHFFDKRGKEIAKVDQEKYLTSYVLDAEGNVLTEERFATKLTGTVTKASDPATLRTSVTGNAADRITTFTYDKVGQRLTEARSSVASASVNGSGVMSTATTTSTITYAYNGLGLISRKTEATGDYVDFTYDNLGRETTATTSAFNDHTATSVQRRTDTFYSGIGQVSRTREGKVATDSAIDRITQYAYGSGGRLSSVTDATGFVRDYAYDAVGHVVKESYTRQKSDATTVTEANAYQYDALGRVKLQATATYGVSGWTFGDRTHLAYNVFGEVTGKGMTAGYAPGETPASPAYQEAFAYDAAGRMWKSNTGDGATRLYLYDAAGNATLVINPISTDLSGYGSLSEALTGLGTSGATGETALAGIAPTITVYDKRGMEVATREPFRELSATSGSNLIVRSRTYNAFGEVASETSARGYTTDYSYNSMGRLIQKQSPTVDWTAENGAIASARPTEDYYYDLSGRLVGTRDANGNLNRRTLLAHSGYGKTEAIALAEYQAGGTDSTNSGVTQYGFDVLGNRRKQTNGLGAVTDFTYDKLGRLTELKRPDRSAIVVGGTTHAAAATGLTEYFAYDGLGRRIQSWNSQLTSTYKQKTDYDAQGRVISSIDYAGGQITYAYVWDDAIETTGLGTFGGRTKTTVNASGKTATEDVDYFNRTVGRVDFGAHTIAMEFDLAGRLTESSGAGNNTYAYFDTGKLAALTEIAGFLNSTTVNSTFAYNLDGQRTQEKHVSTFRNRYRDPITLEWVVETWDITLQDAAVTYDAMGRMLTYDDAGDNGGSPVSVDYEYDLNGNVRRIASSYLAIPTGTSASQDFWYKYDAANRFVTTKGVFTGTRGSGTISAGSTGVDVSYDLASQRATAVSTASSEAYAYTEDGYLATVAIGGTVRVIELRDAMGRATSHTEYQSGGSTVAYSRTATYDVRSQVTTDSTSVRQTDNSVTNSTTTYYYNLESSPGSGSWTGAWMGGLVTYQQTAAHSVPSGGGYSALPTSSIKTSYLWWDEAKQQAILHKPNISGGTTYNSQFSYRNDGSLIEVEVADGRPRVIKYITTVEGQILSREEFDNQTGTDPKNYYYYFDGTRVADLSNDGPSENDYATTISRRNYNQTGSLKYGSLTSFADFDQSYNPINGNSPGSTPGAYVVRDGDTLQSVAAAVWGDASLWYLIADANGLTMSSQMAAGMSLVIPAKIANFHNTSDTFRPYDPNKAIGDIQPTTPPPPSKAGGCGIIGAIIMVIIAVAVVVITKNVGLAEKLTQFFTTIAGKVLPAAAAKVAGAFAAGATIGAASSIASQGVGLAIGAIDEFSWKSVAQSALSGGLGGMGGADSYFSSINNDFVRGALNSVAQNVIGQGVALATGLQRKFDWTGVVVAGVVGGVSELVSKGVETRAIDRAGEKAADQGLEAIFDARAAAARGSWAQGGIVNSTISETAGAMAGAAARSLIEGSSFGDNIVATLPTVIGNTVGRLIDEKLAAKSGVRDEELEFLPVPETVFAADEQIEAIQVDQNVDLLDRVLPEYLDYSYEVRAGDSLWKIASMGVESGRYPDIRTATGAIISASGLKGTTIHPGQIVTLPGSYTREDARLGREVIVADSRKRAAAAAEAQRARAEAAAFAELQDERFARGLNIWTGEPVSTAPRSGWKGSPAGFYSSAPAGVIDFGRRYGESPAAFSRDMTAWSVGNAAGFSDEATRLVSNLVAPLSGVELGRKEGGGLARTRVPTVFESGGVAYWSKSFVGIFSDQIPAQAVAFGDFARDPFAPLRADAADFEYNWSIGGSNLAFYENGYTWGVREAPLVVGSTIPGPLDDLLGAGRVAYATEGAVSPSATARAFQGSRSYPGVDVFRDITLKKGTVVYAGEPGATGFATTRSGFARTGNDAQAIFEGLQVAPRDGLYRPGMTEFVITQDTPAAFGIVRANPQYGSGGLPQLYIPNFADVAQPTVSYPLVSRSARLPK